MNICCAFDLKMELNAQVKVHMLELILFFAFFEQNICNSALYFERSEVEAVRIVSTVCLTNVIRLLYSAHLLWICDRLSLRHLWNHP